MYCIWFCMFVLVLHAFFALKIFFITHFLHSKYFFNNGSRQRIRFVSRVVHVHANTVWRLWRMIVQWPQLWRSSKRTRMMLQRLIWIGYASDAPTKTPAAERCAKCAAPTTPQVPLPQKQQSRKLQLRQQTNLIWKSWLTVCTRLSKTTGATYSTQRTRSSHAYILALTCNIIYM